MKSQRSSGRFWNAGLLAACAVLLLVLGPAVAFSASDRSKASQTYPSGISLNEFLPDPELVDWNDDGALNDPNDEYIEIYNANAFDVDISGWQLDDMASGGTPPYILPAGTVLRAQRHLVLFSVQTGVSLNNAGDTVRLLAPDGSEVETHYYMLTLSDQAYSKTVDGGNEWTRHYYPSPGASNQPPPWTATPTPTTLPTSTPTPTPSLSPTPFADEISLNEFMPDPVTDWNGDGVLGDGNDEYIEIYNSNPFDVDISGWILDDIASGGTQPYHLPAGTVLRSQQYLAFFSAQTNVGLNNSEDTVRLLTPDGVEVDSYSYTQTQPDEAYSRTADDTNQWTRTYPPSPGAPNQPPVWTATPTATQTPSATPTASLTPTATPAYYPPGISLNEFMPNPESDWNNDGILGDDNDEYIELFNANDFAVDLSGWVIDDIDGGSSPYTLPAGAWLPAGSYLAVWRRDSNVALNNSGGDTVRLLRPDGVVVESHSYSPAPADGAYSKPVAGGDTWTMTYPPSPGAANQPPAWTATPTATPRPSPSATLALSPTPYPEGVSINEYMPNPEADWNGDSILGDANDEYIEIYNANAFAVSLSGWQVDDIAGGSAPYTLPAGAQVDAYGFLALWSRDTRLALNNSGGDAVRLIRPDGIEVASHSYAAAPADGAYSRTADGSGAWTPDYPPSPGASNQPAPLTPTPTPSTTPTPASTPTAMPTPTSTPTAMPTPTPTLTAMPTPMPTLTATPTPAPVVFPSGVSLNEYMPDPASDWNGDGAADQDDEYVELYNANDSAVDLSGWRLDDVDDDARQRRFLFDPAGSPVYVLPEGATIPARAFLLLFRSETGVALNNDGDWVRLLRPDGAVVEAAEYTSSRNDQAFSKTADGGDAWTTAYPPSPGASNQPAPTPTPSPTTSPTATATPGVYPEGVSLNEYMPDPASDWNGSGAADEDDEYIELYNAGDAAVDLSGWRLDDVDDAARAAPDGSPSYPLPPSTILPARGFLLFFRSETRITLNNDGDWVRLLRPDGVVVEAVEYSTSRADQAASKTVDGGSEWTRSYLPSPGGTNHPGGVPTPTPSPTPPITPTPFPTTVRLNEVLPSPRDVDWDGNGVPSYLDEWVELVNLGDEPVDLAGWRLADGQPAGHEPDTVYILPAGVVLPARGHLLFFRAQSGLALNASDEWLRLLFPDNSEADVLYFEDFSGYDQSWCRLPDGTGGWSRLCIESPGQPNQSDPNSGGNPGAGSNGNSGGAPAGGQPYDRFNYDLLPIVQARSLPDRARVTLEGQVTVLPDVFDDQTIYMEDATGGMLVYLRSGEWPPLSEGQWVRVNGRLDTFYGEREISLVRIDDIKTLQPAAPPAPLPIRTGDVNEANEGRLAQISGAITGYWKETTLYLDDGSGEARITIRPATGIRRPYVNMGEVWTMVGVVSQSESGYRLLPRRAEDLQRNRAAGARTRSTSAAAASAAPADDTAWNRAPIYLPLTGAVLTVRPPVPANLWEAWHQAVWPQRAP